MKLAVRLASTAAGVLFAGASAAGGVHVVCHCGVGSAHASATTTATSGGHVATIHRDSVFSTIGDAQHTSVALEGQTAQHASAAGIAGAGQAPTGTAGSAQGQTDAGGSAPSTTAPVSDTPSAISISGSGSGAVTIAAGSSSSGGPSANSSGSATVGTTAEASPNTARPTGDTTAASTLTIGPRP